MRRKKLIAKMKVLDEGISVIEFTGLKPKMYSNKKEDDDEELKKRN